MGGYGSGFQGVRRSTVEETTAVDIGWMKRQGYLKAGWYTLTWSWSRTDRKDSIQCQVSEGARSVRFVYKTQPSGADDWLSIDSTAKVSRTKTAFDGRRPWFQCPLCHRRCAKLYLAGRGPQCRKCAGLTYRSSQNNPMERARAKLYAVQRKLKADDWDSMLHYPPPKPTGMHWKTYERLRFKWYEHTFQFNQAWLASAAPFIRRYGQIDPSVKDALRELGL